MDSRISNLQRKLDKSMNRIARLEFEIETMRAKERLCEQSDCFSLDGARRHVKEMIDSRSAIPTFPKTRKAGNEVRALLKSGRDFPVRLSADRVPVPILPPYHLMRERADGVA